MLESFEPKSVWKIFEDIISKIPHESKKEAQLALALKEFVKKTLEIQKKKCEIREDTKGNILFKIPATPGYEHIPGILFQAHLDMVCETDREGGFDFDTQPLELQLDDAKEWVSANGTTLGADDGIGVAIALGLITDPDISDNHGPLEVLLTVEEEIGLFGARELDPAQLKIESAYLVNLDSGRNNFIVVGCAGSAGIRYSKEFPISIPNDDKFQFYKLTVEGLRGGHSAGDIDKNRGNAIKIIARILSPLASIVGVNLGPWAGGTKANAIPRFSEVSFSVPKSQTNRTLPILQEQTRRVRDYLTRADINGSILEPGVELKMVESVPCEVMSPEDSAQVIRFINGLPQGLYQYSPFYSGAKQTSANVSILTSTAGKIEITHLLRGNFQTELMAYRQSMIDLATIAGWNYDDSRLSVAWEEDSNHPFIRKFHSIYEKVAQQPVKIMISHGGLEPAAIKKRTEIISAISIGPTTEDLHSPQERLKIADVPKIYDVLKQVVLDLAENPISDK